MLKIYKRLVLHYYSLTKEKSNSIFLASAFVTIVVGFMVDITLRLCLKEGIVRNKQVIVFLYLIVLTLSLRLFKSYSKDKMEDIVKHNERYSRKRSGMTLVGSIIVVAIATGLYIVLRRTLEY